VTVTHPASDNTDAEQYVSIGHNETIPPFFPLEALWNRFTDIMLWIAALITGLLVVPICVDIVTRTFFGFAINGIIEISTLSLIPIAFFAIGFLAVSRQHIQIDLFFDMFSVRNRVRLVFLANLVCFCASAIMVRQTFIAGAEQPELTPFLFLPIQWFIWVTTVGFFCAAVAFFFRLLHSLRDLHTGRDAMGLLLTVACLAFLIALPFMYRASDVRLSGLIIGCLGFFVLLSLLLLRVPVGFAMIFIAVLGLICLKRTPEQALSIVGDIPYLHTADFILTAIPMFMLMGELALRSGLASDLFECANRWLGRFPGGLATASVGGCAGFSAVCGDSLPTVITMSKVALPSMRKYNYDLGLATGALAAGGTLGILIPPSIGFIFYSVITEVSVGRLFMAAILPGIMVTLLFVAVIIIQVTRNPSLAPRGEKFSLSEKMISLVYLLPVFGLFFLVVGGILAGIFTPGEGGAVGSAGAFLYALARGRMTLRILLEAIYSTAILSGKIFLILAGAFCFGAFLSDSRLPQLLASFITGLDVNRYVVLSVIIAMYIILGTCMNILPLMLLTLPSIYPTIEALGFDGVWFGVLAVMLMELGLITPPMGMVVFTLASVAPDIPMWTIFKGVLPFVLALFVGIVLVALFPQIALWLPNLMFG